jgi:F0F1-type ATP synthase alpha subunit
MQEVDVIAPLARGQAMLLAGPQNQQQSRTMLAMVANQAGSEVQVIYASTGQSPETLEEYVQQLHASGVMPQCTVVAAPAHSSLGAQFAALGAALALGEDVRNRGHHAFVVLDSMDCAVRLWDSATQHAGAIVQSALALLLLHEVL